MDKIRSQKKNIKSLFHFQSGERLAISILAILALIMSMVPSFVKKPGVGSDQVIADKIDTLLSGMGDKPRGNPGAYGYRDRPPHFAEAGTAEAFPRQPPTRRYDDGRYGSRSPRHPAADTGVTHRGRARYSGAYQRNSFEFKRRPEERARQIVEINRADTSDFIALPGIGRVLAARIVAYRRKLGGFSSVDQLAMVYGLKDSVFRMIAPRLVCDTVDLRNPDQ